MVREIVPELNLWINKTLYNTENNYEHVNYPVLISEFWRCNDSVIELLFNETCDPSGKIYDDGYHFIYKYRTVNKDRIYHNDSVLWSRIQIYRDNLRVYAPIDDKFKDVFNLYSPNLNFYETVTSGDGYPYPNDAVPTEYVTKYRSEIITSGNDQLHKELPDGENPPTSGEDCPYVEQRGENIFLLTEEELQMCEYLYYYRSEQFELIEPFGDNFYYELQSPLSKWIYLYLQCYLFNMINYEQLNTITKKEDGIIRLYAEKYFSDRIYSYVQKQHTSIWNDVKDLGSHEKRIFETYTQYNLTLVYKRRITEEDINRSQIIIEESKEKQPSENTSFEFIYDGVKLKQGYDYNIENAGTLSKPQIIVSLNKEMKLNNKYQFLFSYLPITTPQSRRKGFKNGN